MILYFQVAIFPNLLTILWFLNTGKEIVIAAQTFKLKQNIQIEEFIKWDCLKVKC